MVFARVPLPEIKDEAEEEHTPIHGTLLNRAFILGMVALFLYVAAQTGVNCFFINYMTENAGIDHTTASLWLGFGGMGLFVFGRLTGSWLMSRVPVCGLLFVYAALAALATLVIVLLTGLPTLVAFAIVYLCESIMFPTIFALALRSSNGNTKLASSLLIMTIVGGAIAPPIMGYVADVAGSMAPAFVLPLICFAYIALYSLVGVVKR